MGEWTIRDYYKVLLQNECYFLKAQIEMLVYEKQVLTFRDSMDKLSYYTQPRFQQAMNRHTDAYIEKQQALQEGA